MERFSGLTPRSYTRVPSNSYSSEEDPWTHGRKCRGLNTISLRHLTKRREAPADLSCCRLLDIS